MHTDNKKISTGRILGAYLSSVISISLVLLLVGIGTLLISNARNVADYFKESLVVSVLMEQGVNEKSAEKYVSAISEKPFVKSTRIVSREEGTEDLKKMLGDDFLRVFETSPVPVSVDVFLKADYVSPDSLAVIIPILSDSKMVDEVSCQQSLVEALNANLGRISLFLGIFIILLLFVSYVLIGNTVRISLFAKRFTIHTMKMVGATKWFIIKPFMRDAAIQGLISAGVSLLLLGIGEMLLKRAFSQIFEVMTTSSLITTAFAIIASGILICAASSYFTVGKLIRGSKADLYF